MSELDRVVAGISCREVLENLSAYVDGELPAAQVERIEAHLQECDRCERFGGRFAQVIGTLRRELSQAPPVDPNARTRLRDRLSGV
ncbi:MAG: anti-sigma factor family protein [Gemmatimonadota bacterium]